MQRCEGRQSCQIGKVSIVSDPVLGRNLVDHWGVGISDQFVEVVATKCSDDVMTIVGPKGFLAVGIDTVDEEDLPGRFPHSHKLLLEHYGGYDDKASFRSKILNHITQTNYTETPRGKLRPVSREVSKYDECTDVATEELFTRTLKTDGEIQKWCKKWVSVHPTYIMVSESSSTFGGEANCQTFAVEFSKWLCPYADVESAVGYTNNEWYRRVAGGVACFVAAGLTCAMAASSDEPPIKRRRCDLNS